MSKPNKPGELRDVEVEAISLVSKAANRKKFKIFKSADEELEQPDKGKEKGSEAVTKDERGLFQILKEFFTGEKIEKGEVADIVNSQDKGKKLGRAMDALFAVLGTNRYGDSEAKMEKDASKIRAALSDFKNVAEKILIDDNEEIKKSGRKISSSRYTKLKNIQTELNALLEGLEENKEETELTKEEVIKAVEDALKPIAERIEKLETESEKADPTPASEPENKGVDVAEVVKTAIGEAITPLTERIEKIEKARGFSNKVPEDTQIEKNGDGFWGQIF